jgi:FkbM family methyltransferase
MMPPNYLFANPTPKKVRRDGVLMNLNLHDYMDHALFFDFNDQSRESLFESAAGAETIVDVGANNGYTALRLASLDGVNSVIAFEPDATNFEKARRNIALNKVTEKIELLGIGLGPGDLELNLQIGIEGNSGTMKVAASTEGGATASRVKVRKLDDVLAESGITRVDFIKIDVEGYELEVLNGAVETLRSSRPRLFIEVDDANLSEQSSSARQLIGFLIGHGYSCTNSITGESLSIDYDFIGKHFDAICVPASM